MYYHLTHKDWQLLGGFDPHYTLYSSAPIIGAMTIIFVTLLSVVVWSEQCGNPTFAAIGIDQSQTSINPGGNMEGKEVRFGVANSALWATTTAASNGSVNSMHDSYMPLGGLI